MSEIDPRDHFFNFSAIDEEIVKKLKSRDWDHRFCKALFLLVTSLLSLECDERKRLEMLYDDIFHNYSTVGKDLIHPTRVLASYLLAGKGGNYDTISMLLAHNIREVGKGSFGQIEKKYLSESSSKEIEILTIDRARERDHTYMIDYYNKIHDKNLIEIKALDKLDNFLEFPTKKVDIFYFNVLDKYLFPLMKGDLSTLRRYLEDVSLYVRQNVTKTKYENY